MTAQDLELGKPPDWFYRMLEIAFQNGWCIENGVVINHNDPTACYKPNVWIPYKGKVIRYPNYVIEHRLVELGLWNYSMM